MKRGFLLVAAAVIMLSIRPVSRAEEGELGVTYDLSYHSRWLSKGVQGYGQQGAIFNTIDIDFYGSGFGAKVVHRNATSSGYVDKQRLDYRPYFKSKIFEGQPYETKYLLSVGYEHYYGRARNKANSTYEWVFGFSWPKLLTENLVPSYIAHYEYPAGSDYNYAYITGWVHRFRLDYKIDLPQLLPTPLNLSNELAYTDGLGDAAHDWSYYTIGLSTKFAITENLTFAPGIYHQTTMDNSISKRDDITYTILSMKYKF